MAIYTRSNHGWDCWVKHKEGAVGADNHEAMAIFSAVLPSIATAIRIHGDSGMRIQLDIDDSHVAQALKLMLWRNTELRVTVRPVREKEDSGGEAEAWQRGEAKSPNAK